MTERIEQISQLTCQRTERVVAGARRRPAVPRQVGRDHRVVARQRLDHRLPVLQAARDPVDQQQHRTRPSLDIPQRPAMQRDRSRLERAPSGNGSGLYHGHQRSVQADRCVIIRSRPRTGEEHYRSGVVSDFSMSQPPPSTLADRERVLARLEQVVGDAWASFDAPRASEPDLNPALAERMRSALPELPGDAEEAVADAAHLLDTSVSPCRPLFLAYIGSTGLEMGVLAAALTATYDTNLATSAGGADLRRIPGARVAGGVRRLPARRRCLHQRRHDLESDRTAGRPRSPVAGLSRRGSRQPASRDLLLRGGAPLDRPRRRGLWPGHRRGASRADGRLATDASRPVERGGAAGPRSRNGSGRGGRHRRHHADRCGRPDRRDRRRVRRASDLAPHRRCLRPPGGGDRDRGTVVQGA